ncbi:MAG: hypothetical protein Q8R33_24515 [Burkholderiales bacterium]|nr:hypothetical protein [Burkholderiales bacterium]
MNGERPKQDPLPADAPSEGENAVPRSGNGAETALQAMLRRRQMRAGAEPQPPLTDGRKARKK